MLAAKETYESDIYANVNIILSVLIPAALFLYAGKRRERCTQFYKGAKWSAITSLVIHIMTWVVLVAIQYAYYPNTLYRITVIPVISVCFMFLLYIPVAIKSYLTCDFSTFWLAAMMMTTYQLALWNVAYAMLNMNPMASFGEFAVPFCIVLVFGLAPLVLLRTVDLCCSHNNDRSCCCAACCANNLEKHDAVIAVFEDDVFDEEGGLDSLSEPLLRSEQEPVYRRTANKPDPQITVTVL